MKLEKIEEIKEWVNSQDWYQKIKLSNGIVTPGKVDISKRYRFFKGVDFNGKKVIDVGCNSGGYCLMAKRRGADRVVGIDINKKRLYQAKVLSSIEGYDIEFINKNMFEIREMGKFDVVFCISVLTEIQNIFGAVEILKLLIGDCAFIELDLAKPVFYLSRSKNWLKKRAGISRMKAVTEIRCFKGWVLISPSLEVLSKAFGDNYNLKYLGRGPRHEMVKIIKTS